MAKAHKRAHSTPSRGAHRSSSNPPPKPPSSMGAGITTEASPRKTQIPKFSRSEIAWLRKNTDFSVWRPVKFADSERKMVIGGSGFLTEQFNEVWGTSHKADQIIRGWILAQKRGKCRGSVGRAEEARYGEDDDDWTEVSEDDVEEGWELV